MWYSVGYIQQFRQFTYLKSLIIGFKVERKPGTNEEEKEENKAALTIKNSVSSRILKSFVSYNFAL